MFSNITQSTAVASLIWGDPPHSTVVFLFWKHLGLVTLELNKFLIMVPPLTGCMTLKKCHVTLHLFIHISISSCRLYVT